MARVRLRALLQLSRILAIVALFAAAGCSSSGELPSADQQEDLSTFRLNPVTGSTNSQEAVSNSSKKRVLVTFETKVYLSATGVLLDSPGLPFNIFEDGAQVKTTKLDNAGVIKWQKYYEIENGVSYPYTPVTFRIEGTGKYRGSRTVRVKVNPAKEGAAAVIDVTDGTVDAPVAPTSSVQPKLKADGTLTDDSLPEFFVRSMTAAADDSDPDSQTISPITRSPTRFVYKFRVCVNSKAQKYPSVPADQIFVVRGFEDKKAQEVETDGEGCFIYTDTFSGFQFLTQQRWFKRHVEIRAKNRVVKEGPKVHTYYIDPWRKGEAAIFLKGQDLDMAKQRPIPSLVDGTQENKAAQHPPRIHLTSYVTNYFGRDFAINDDLDISTQRRYEFAFRPFVERWTADGYRAVDLSRGKFRVKLLLLKTHAEALDQYPNTPEGQKLLAEELLCFNKDNPYDLIEDLKLRHQCYARAFLDYKEIPVEMKAGEIAFEATLNFSDLRYVSSRNLLYIELVPDDKGTDGKSESGLETSTFVSAFMPLEDSSRRLRDAMRAAFVYYPDEDINNRTRMDQIDLDSAFSRWEKEPLPPEVLSYLQELARRLPKAEGKLLTEEMDAKLNVEKHLPKDYTYTPDQLQRRELVFRAVKDHVKERLQPDSIDTIMAAVKRESPRLVTLRELQLGEKRAEGMAKIDLFRRKNRFRPGNEIFGDQELATLLRHTRSKHDDPENPTNLEAEIEMTDDVRRVLGRACEAVYPDRDSKAAQEEAERFARAEWEKALQAYAKQREILCKLQHVMTTKVYTTNQLDVAKIPSHCEIRRPVCAASTRASKNPPKLSGFARMVRWVISSDDETRQSEVCPGTRNRDAQLFQALATNNRNLLQHILSVKADVETSVIETLAGEYLKLMPFSLVRTEVVHQFDVYSDRGVQFHLDSILLDPKVLSRDHPRHKEFLRDPRYQEYVKRFAVRTRQDRCKLAPFSYLGLNWSEHVLRITGRPRTLRAGSSNVSVFANIDVGLATNKTKQYGAARTNQTTSSAKVSMGTTANLQAGLSFSGVGVLSASANLSEQLNLGSEKSITTSHTWYISDTLSNTDHKGTSSGEGTSRTLNVEEVTFGFQADVLSCLSIQAADPITRRRLPHGFMRCKDSPESRQITETWHYIYLFFRNNNSPLHDAAADFLMRPWTALIRGEEQFEFFKSLLQNASLKIKLSPASGPEKAMNKAFQDFDGYRLERNLPGLLTLKNVVPPRPPKKVGED